MHKFIKIASTVVATTLLFGSVFSVHAEETSTLGKIVDFWAGGAVAPIILADKAVKAVSGSSIPELALKKTLDIGAGIGSSFIGWVSVKAIGYLLFVLSYIAGFIGSTVFTLAGLFVEFGLYLNTTILDGEVVQLGWRFCRDLANLGFTIGIVVIAYATMLGIESYGMKKLIQNFVIAAVMVNFSFSIAGFAIDMSNMLTHFFVNAAIGGGAGQVGVDSIHKFTETLASAFNPQKLLVTDSGNIKVYESLSSNDGIIAAVLSMFFVALFTAFCALGMLMVGLTTISRFVYLSGLIILMPLAVLCYAFPNTKKYYGDWYKQFTCQLTYLPTATFAMYIVIMFVQVKSNIGFGNAQAVDLGKLLDTFEAAKGAPGGLTSTRTLELMAAPFRTITDMILVLTMLFYGITKSRTIGCAGGDVALKWAQGLRGWAIGTVTGAPAWAGRKVLSGGVDEEGRNRGTRLGNIMSNIPLVRRLIPRLNDFAAGTSKNIGNLVTENKKLGKVQLMTKMRSLEILTSAEDMAAAAKVAAEEGYFSEEGGEEGLTQKEFERFIAPVKRYGMEADILKKLPHLYGKFGLNVEKENGEYVNKEHGKKLDDAIKGLKPEDVENLPVEAFADSEVVKRLSGDQLQKLPKGDEHRKAFSKTVVRLREEMGSAEEFDKYFKKAFGKKETASALTPQLLANKDVVRNLTNDHLKYFSDADKKKQRDAFLATINEKKAGTDEYEFSEKEFSDFMKNNFAKGKDITDIHPDILRNERVFSKLQGMHISQLQKEPDTAQHVAILETLRAGYKDNNQNAYETNSYSTERTAHLDDLAGVIVKNKDNSSWSVIDTPEGRDAFREIEAEYRSRHPDENAKPKNQNQQGKNKPDDTDPYGPSPKGPYPPAGGGPSSGGAPPKPPTPPPPPPPPVTNVSPNPIPQGKAWEPQPTVDADWEPKNKIEYKPETGAFKRITKKTGAPAPATDVTEAEKAGKAIDIGNAIDGILGGMKDDEAVQPINAQRRQETPKEPDQAELESIQPEGMPAVPPELNELAEGEANRLKQETKKAVEQELLVPLPKQPPVDTKKERYSEPIDIEFTRITESAEKQNQPAAAEAPLKRIAYQGPVTPPPTPTLPEPIRTILQKEKNEKDNQVERKNTL